MARFSTTTRTVLALCVLGAALHLYQVIHAALDQHGAAPETWALLFLGALLLWSCLPYLACAFVAMVKNAPVPALGGVLGMLAFDGYMHYSVFIHPTGSTAAIGLLFAPLWNLLVFGPAGAAVLWIGVWLCNRLRRRRSSLP